MNISVKNYRPVYSLPLAAMITVSIQDFRTNPQDNSKFYLENIFWLLADPNVTRTSISSTAVKPSFSPPGYVVWVNELWFSSLAISLTSAFLATLFQKWTRRYIVLHNHWAAHTSERGSVNSFLLAPATCPLYWRLTQCPPITSFGPPLLCWPPYPAKKYQSYRLLCRGSVGRASRCGLHMHHVSAIFQPAGPHYAQLTSSAWQFYTDIQYHVCKVLLQSTVGWSLVDVQLGFCEGAFRTGLYFAEMSI